MRVSVICTVLNEGESLRNLLDSLRVQTRPADEIVFVDGGSSDGTVAILAEYANLLPLRVLTEKGANISRGRNVAIQAATGDVIASTDAGVWLEPQWLERLVAPMASALMASAPMASAPMASPTVASVPLPSAAAGFFVPDPQTTFEMTLGATVLPALADITPSRFLPSSRSAAYTHQAWEAAGGYPEWLDYCEDLIFDIRLLEEVGPFAWAPDAVAHFRPRGSLRAFAKQYYRYARGDGKADLWRKRHAVRYATYLVALPVLLALAVVHHPAWLLILAAGVVGYCRRPYGRLRLFFPELPLLDRIRAVLLIPVIRAVGDLAKMLGYPVGWAWRLRNWRQPEIHWRSYRRQL